MTSVDALRARKRELLARKKYEAELQAAGKGDNLALFMVNEELLDVNAQLKMLTVGRRKSSVHAAASDYAKDYQQYLDWRQADTALDEEIDEGHAQMVSAAVQGLDLLTARQRETLELHLAGRTADEIANMRGVNRSTVSRTLARAKRNVRAVVERVMVEKQLRESYQTINLNNPVAAKAVLLAMTTKQTVYFYLYYSEYLTLREIGALTGTDHAAIMRTIRRALRNIEKLLGGQGAILENPEALDEFAYQAYCEVENHPELLPANAPKPTAYHPSKNKSYPRKDAIPTLRSISVHVLRISRYKKISRSPGKLLSALLERRNKSQSFIFRWLETVFAVFQKKLRGNRKEAQYET